MKEAVIDIVPGPDLGFRVTSGNAEIRVDALEDLEVHGPTGEPVGLYAITNEWYRRLGRLDEAGYVVIELATGAGDMREAFRLSTRQAEVVSRLLPALAARLGDESPESASEIADRMIASIPSSDGHRWQELIGPFYSANDVAAWRGVSRQHIHKLRKQGVLLGAQTRDAKMVVFPAWQFGAKGQALPHLHDVVVALGRAAPDEWAQALWLNQKTDRLGGQSAAELLKAGETERVLEAARADAAGLAA